MLNNLSIAEMNSTCHGEKKNYDQVGILPVMKVLLNIWKLIYVIYHINKQQTIIHFHTKEEQSSDHRKWSIKCIFLYVKNSQNTEIERNFLIHKHVFRKYLFLDIVVKGMQDKRDIKMTQTSWQWSSLVRNQMGQRDR